MVDSRKEAPQGAVSRSFVFRLTQIHIPRRHECIKQGERKISKNLQRILAARSSNNLQRNQGKTKVIGSFRKRLLTFEECEGASPIAPRKTIPRKEVPPKLVFAISDPSQVCTDGRGSSSLLHVFRTIFVPYRTERLRVEGQVNATATHT